MTELSGGDLPKPPLTIDVVQRNMDKFLAGPGGRAIGTYDSNIQSNSSEAIRLCGQIMLGVVDTVDLITLSRMDDYMADLNQAYAFPLMEGSITDDPVFPQLRLGIMKRLQTAQLDIENDREFHAFSRLYIVVRSFDRDTYSRSAWLRAVTRNLLHRNLDESLHEQLWDITDQTKDQRQKVAIYIKERVAEEIKRLEIPKVPNEG